ncbi:MAG: hypothetical protein WC004_04045 [Candidatus Absconditabacterales bacterium]
MTTIFVKGTAYYRNPAYAAANWFWAMFIEPGGWSSFAYILSVDKAELEKDQNAYLLPLVAEKKRQEGYSEAQYDFTNLSIKDLSWSCPAGGTSERQRIEVKSGGGCAAGFLLFSDYLISFLLTQKLQIS